MSFRLIAAVTGLALLSACNTVQRPLPQAGSMDAGWGEASRWNAAVQTINPDPVYTAAGAQPGDSGAKAANASRRYRTDQVKDTKPASTTGGSTGSGGGASGPR